MCWLHGRSPPCGGIVRPLAKACSTQRGLFFRVRKTTASRATLQTWLHREPAMPMSPATSHVCLATHRECHGVRAPIACLRSMRQCSGSTCLRYKKQLLGARTVPWTRSSRHVRVRGLYLHVLLTWIASCSRMRRRRAMSSVDLGHGLFIRASHNTPVAMAIHATPRGSFSKRHAMVTARVVHLRVRLRRVTRHVARAYKCACAVSLMLDVQ